MYTHMCVQTNLRSTMRMGIPRRLRTLIRRIPEGYEIHGN